MTLHTFLTLRKTYYDLSQLKNIFKEKPIKVQTARIIILVGDDQNKKKKKLRRLYNNKHERQLLIFYHIYVLIFIVLLNCESNKKLYF